MPLLLLLGAEPTRAVIVRDMLAHVAAIPSTADGESAQRPQDARPERPVAQPEGGGEGWRVRGPMPFRGRGFRKRGAALR